MTDESERMFTPLGYDGRYFYVLPNRGNKIVAIRHDQLRTKFGCLQVVRNVEFWEDVFPAKNNDGERADWNRAGESIMHHCMAKGFYNSRKPIRYPEKRYMMPLCHWLGIDAEQEYDKIDTPNQE